jgi:arginyl-tRNA synthetase
VLKGDNKHRLLITKCVAQVIDNGLKICHIQPLERI